MALYHRLDPFWKHVRFPGVIDRRVDDMAGVKRIRVARRVLGRVLMPVYCYAVGDTLVDTGMPASAAEVLDVTESLGIRRAFVTHHHEDHSGGAAALLEAGIDVGAGPLTARLLALDLPLLFYQHLVWGRLRPARVRAVRQGSFPVGALEARIVEAPGHSVDQVVLHVPERGWLFSADVFIHERVKIFRRDEDFAASVTTLERLLALDFDVLFCGHRPIEKGGKDALRRKLSWLREVEGATRRHDAAGLPVPEIVRRLGLGSQGAMVGLTMGDASPANLVRSILHGPTPRPEVAAALRDDGPDVAEA